MIRLTMRNSKLNNHLRNVLGFWTSAMWCRKMQNPAGEAEMLRYLSSFNL